jgi:hypothetical protein
MAFRAEKPASPLQKIQFYKSYVVVNVIFRQFIFLLAEKPVEFQLKVFPFADSSFTLFPSFIYPFHTFILLSFFR